MVSQSEFTAWLLAWIACMGFVLWRQRRDGSGAGLVISYVLQFWVIHWLGASIYALPWYQLAPETLLLGVQQSTYGILGFAIGSELLMPLLVRRSAAGEVALPTNAELIDPALVHFYLIAGLVTFLVLEPILHPIPTIGALASVGSNLLLVALGMECWNGLQREHRSSTSFWRWVLMTMLLPITTILTKGFLSYGFAAMLTVFSFVASFFRPRKKLVVWGLVAGYLALSVYVTYMRDRRDIRASVWGQEAYSARLSTLARTFTDFEFLDLTNVDHLLRIDDRLNQNTLVGASVAYLESYPDRFAFGRTLWEAVLAPIPRALWPDKPMVAGSGDLVSEFTGIRFDQNTSVGIGHVMEWYVNFGTAGVLFGMALMGAAIGYLDKRAAQFMHSGDWSNFTLMWLPGLSLLQIGGSLVEAVSGAGAAAVVAIAVRSIQRKRHRVRTPDVELEPLLLTRPPRRDSAMWRLPRP